jgi:hypothetical protein
MAEMTGATLDQIGVRSKEKGSIAKNILAKYWSRKRNLLPYRSCTYLMDMRKENVYGR